MRGKAHRNARRGGVWVEQREILVIGQADVALSEEPLAGGSHDAGGDVGVEDGPAGAGTA